MIFSRAEDELLVRSATTSPPTERLTQLLREPLDWQYVIDMARRNGVTPLLWRALTYCGDSIPEDAANSLRRSVSDTRQSNLAHIVGLLKILRLLDANKIVCVPLKGPVLAELAYGDAVLREYADLDILVRRDQIQTAQALLQTLGFLPYVEPSDHHDEHHVKAYSAKMNIMVELHWNLMQEYYIYASFLDDFWKDIERIELFNQSIAAPTPENLLIYLCLHGHKHRWARLIWICDIAQVLATYSKDLDWGQVLRECERLRVQRALYLALWLAQDTVGAITPEWLSAKIARDPQLKRTGAQIQEQLFLPQTQAVAELNRHIFHVSMSETLMDRLVYLRRIIARQLTPTAKDRDWISLPKPLEFIYYVFRPLRLLKEYGTQVASGLWGRRHP